MFSLSAYRLVMYCAWVQYKLLLVVTSFHCLNNVNELNKKKTERERVSEREREREKKSERERESKRERERD